MRLGRTRTSENNYAMLISAIVYLVPGEFGAFTKALVDSLPEWAGTTSMSTQKRFSFDGLRSNAYQSKEIWIFIRGAECKFTSVEELVGKTGQKEADRAMLQECQA